MLFIYRFLINLTIVFLPIIGIYRIIKGKENINSIKEKFGFYTKYNKGKLIWFHGSSVGEIMSVIPLIQELEKNKKINKILITSNTLSSSKIIPKFKFKKTIHQFYPIDSNFLVKKFLNHWNPSLCIFIESEIWPNMLYEIKKKNTPLILLNARITKKSFNRWNRFKEYSKSLFNKFNICLVQNKETAIYLSKLGCKNIKKIGNLKLCENKKIYDYKLNNFQKNFFKNKKVLLCGLSTHNTEEKFCINIFKSLKKKTNEILILIPRHINRVDEIIRELNQNRLMSHKHSIKSKINKNTKVYLVDTYGEAKKFVNLSNIVFQGGSLIPHGGQNPLEAVREGCLVIHGPNVQNFTEIYSFLNKEKISFEFKNINKAKKLIKSKINIKSNNKKIKIKLKKIGLNILNNTKNEILNYV